MKWLWAAVMILIVAQPVAMAENITFFQGGNNEAVVILNFPGCLEITNITLPAECYILNASMNVSALIPDGDGSGSPRAVQVLLNNTLLWEFNGTDYGALGMQNRFVGATSSWKSWFGDGGGSNGTALRLPKSASVQNAALEMNCIGPGGMQRFINFTENATGEFFGYSIANAGDVNKDGCDDIIVGAPHNNTNGVLAGGGYIYFGGASMDSVADVIFTESAAGDEFGISVAGAGDVNNDGYDDVIVGAPFNGTGGTRTGSAYIFFGGANMDNMADVVLLGSGPNDDFGHSVSSAGDINNDSYCDIAIGSSWFSSSTTSGKVSIYFGESNMDNISDLNITGATIGDHFGCSISSAGDVNNDSYDDLIVGAYGNDSAGPDAGMAYIYFGGTNMNGTADVILAGAAADDHFGLSVSTAGDIDNDGHDDVIVGAPGNDSGGMDAGRAYIYLGGDSMDNTADVLLTGGLIGYCFGNLVSSAGDVNHDGYDDVIVGEPSNDTSCQINGKAYIFFGGTTIDNTADIILTGDTIGDLFSFSIAGGGDFDNDSYDDVAISAFNYNVSFRAYLFSHHNGIPSPDVSVDQTSVMNYTGYTNGTYTSLDFSQVLNDYLRTAVPTGTDGYGNAYVDIPVGVSAKGPGNISLGKLNIAYNYTATTLEFASELNSYIAIHYSEKDVAGNISVPFRVKSQTPGKVKLLDLNIIADMAPAQLRTIPNLEMDEDTYNSLILDLQQFFKDDYDPMGQLKFEAASATNANTIRTGVVFNRYLSVDANYGTRNDNWTGEVDIIIRVSDTRGSLTLSNPFHVAILNVPDPPVFTSIPTLNATSNRKYTYKVTAEDGDGDKLVYSLVKGPQNMTIDKHTGSISWIPGTKGDYEVSIAVGDGMFTIYQDYVIMVPNRPPRALTTTIPAAYVDVPYTCYVSATDDDGDCLEFTIMSFVPGMTINIDTGEIHWTPSEAGEYPVSIKIDDSTDYMIFDFNIVVIQGNRAPQFVSDPVIKAITGIQYRYDANATDLDGDNLAFDLVTVPAGMNIDASSGLIIWMPTASGKYTVRLRISDGGGGESFQDFTITVAIKVKPGVEILQPEENEMVNGKVVVMGWSIKGSLDVVAVQYRLDDGQWIDAVGKSSWNFILDTSNLTDGAHLLEVRAFDGTDYSNVDIQEFVVDNPKSSNLDQTLRMISETAMGALFVLAIIGTIYSRWGRKK